MRFLSGGRDCHDGKRTTGRDMAEVTVKVHRHNMMVKLNAKNVPDLVRIADTPAIATMALSGRLTKPAEESRFSLPVNYQPSRLGDRKGVFRCDCSRLIVMWWTAPAPSDALPVR